MKVINLKCDIRCTCIMEVCKLLILTFYNFTFLKFTDKILSFISASDGNYSHCTQCILHRSIISTMNEVKDMFAFTEYQQRNQLWNCLVSKSEDSIRYMYIHVPAEHASAMRI